MKFKKREKNDQPIKEVLDNWVNSLKLKSKLTETKIRIVWRELMGKTINGYTTSIKIHNKKLYLVISSSSLKHELFLGREKIRKMINDELKEEYIVEVVVRWEKLFRLKNSSWIDILFFILYCVNKLYFYVL